MSGGMSRRAVMLSAGSAVILAGCAARAQPGAPAETPPPRSGAGRHVVKPLPFAPGSLKGLSERLVVSHHDNNYAGAVKNLLKAEEELSRVTKDTPPLVVGALKQAELGFRNSATLHELYFDNLGGDGRASGAAASAFAAAHGSAAAWEEHFRATAASLGGGSGWVITGWDLHRDAIVTAWSGNHTQTASAVLPLLVLDMYEHAYQMDYGAAAARYVDAFFANVSWAEVDRRFERARRAAAALRA